MSHFLIKFNLALFLIAVLVLIGCDSDSSAMDISEPQERETIYVDGRHIYSAAGERMVLRGVNEMFVWSSDPTGEWVVEEIAKTGANSIRIVTTTDYDAADLDVVIQNSIQNGMVPMPECHSATGRWDDLQNCVDYWLRPDIVEVINRHEKWVLLNIANEAGDANVTEEEFMEGYTSAINQIRDAGIRVPLVIDGVDWGKEYKMLLDSWDVLNDHDPENAIIVSVHTYWVGTEEDRKNDYRYIIDKVVNDEIPFIIGEGPTPSGWDCTESPYEWALEKLEEHQIGWLAWSWGLIRNGDCNDPVRFDMTEGGVFGDWKTEFGRLTAVDHSASIQNTSRRPCSIPNAGENCVEPWAGDNIIGLSSEQRVRPIDKHGKLQVSGNRIVNEHGEIVQLMGMSLPWTAWGGEKFYTPEVVNWLVKDWDIDLIRASMSVDIESEPQGWKFNKEFQYDMVETVIDAAVENGIYVLIDWHTHHLRLDEAKEFFGTLAEKYGDLPNIIWETFNEPVRLSWPEIRDYTIKVTEVIREHSPNLIIAGTRNWSQYVDEASEEPLPDTNTAYSLHFYAGTHGDGLRARGDTALENGIALFITEWGMSEADGGRNQEIYSEKAQIWIDWAIERDLSMANWHIVDWGESSAALKSGASTTGGWNPETDLTQSGSYVRNLILKVNSGKYHVE